MSPQSLSTFLFSLKVNLHIFLWSEKRCFTRERSSRAWPPVQNVFINIIGSPKYNFTQAFQNNNMTQRSKFQSWGTGICFMLGERRIKRATQTHPIHSVWYCWLKLKTADAYSDLKSCGSSISGFLHKTQVALFSTFLHECQGQFSLKRHVLHLLCIPQGTGCSQRHREEGIHSHWLQWENVGHSISVWLPVLSSTCKACWGACHTINIQPVFIAIKVRKTFLTCGKMPNYNNFLGISSKDRPGTSVSEFWVATHHK